MRSYIISSKSRALCSSYRVCGTQRKRQQRRQLVHMSHEERLELVSSYTRWGHGYILSGFLLLATLAVVAPKVSWRALEDPYSAALIGWLLGMGLGSSLVLVCFESSRHLKTANKIKNIDEELLETWTISLEEDELLNELSDNESENEDTDKQA